ncbi:MAG: diguanylate cyclase [Desulfoprunum sp.]|nr:diguanylate cyclase [Desulfoprunum sp.]
MNILIIEPSRIFQLALESIFRAYATNIFISASGTEAMDIYNKTPIDLICLSFYLADMDGIAFVSDIRKLQFGETIPILMITSKKSQEATATSLNDGVTEIFRKNALDELEKYLQIFAEQARQQAQIEGSILLIDSDQSQAAEIRTFFKDTRLKFIHFTNAEEAAEMARAAEFDLVITNVILGGSMSGMSLIREIREINETMYRVPILAISAISNASQKIELLRAGANDYIQKPILLEELRVRMKNLLLNKKLFDTVELQKEQLEEMATRDQLTGLYNRHYLIGIADKAVNESYRYQYPFSVLVLDLDHFKKINDTHGHAIGDVVLKAVAELLLKTFRGSDTPVRFGGEEFIILLPHCDGQGAITRAQSLRKQISELCPMSIPISVSIGISQTPSDAQVGYEELFAAADQAVYTAKAHGRNCVVFQEFQQGASKHN